MNYVVDYLKVLRWQEFNYLAQDEDGIICAYNRMPKKHTKGYFDTPKHDSVKIDGKEVKALEQYFIEKFVNKGTWKDAAEPVTIDEVIAYFEQM